MRRLIVFIEINGIEYLVGSITGNSSEDACFQYHEDYVQNIGKPISISLPLQKEMFEARQTKNFFEGLLPEGFSRRAVATWMHADENDYLTILAKLGHECIGALRVIEEETEYTPAEYERLTADNVKALAMEGATKSAEILMESHLSLTGASGKVGLFYDPKEDIWYQPKGDAPSTHIVKQSHVRLDKIVPNELLCLKTSKKMGIETADCFLIDTDKGRGEDILFAAKRYDRIENSPRIISGYAAPFRLHQEDFAQALGIPSSEKYEKNNAGYMKKMFECIRRYSSNPIEDQLSLWDRIIFNCLIGNTDGHIKNYSLLYDRSLSRIRLAPAYDIVSTRIYGLSGEMSFSIGGVQNMNEINREAFIIAAKDVGIAEKMAMSRYDHMRGMFEQSLQEATAELCEMGLPDVKDIRDRILSGI